ncbi:hypothetical protein [Nocardiopsis ansamitocini]|uniref:Uncharacterized protein n=1 Tax=Nocardiopsis ansamitocini TaxID=1670832 RepID=A0A9W6P4D0_9ACTN|nr:hypothetical protein [Nocardiopsis ansamitocini]GLU46793.1 hypothetical protein Nans01_11440 [Nocardiopsis ansamitocini]
MPTDEVFSVFPPDVGATDACDAGYRPTVDLVRTLTAGSRPVLVRCRPGPDAPEDLAQTLALVSVYAWLGVRFFATGHPLEVRQALDLVASVQGARPPAAARRGLA